MAENAEPAVAGEAESVMAEGTEPAAAEAGVAEKQEGAEVGTEESPPAEPEAGSEGELGGEKEASLKAEAAVADRELGPAAAGE